MSAKPAEKTAGFVSMGPNDIYNSHVTRVGFR